MMSLQQSTTSLYPGQGQPDRLTHFCNANGSLHPTQQTLHTASYVAHQHTVILLTGK